MQSAANMHRAYQPILPCGNKYLQQKWDKTYYDEHMRKVQSAKPMVDTNSPRTYAHLNTKLKKLKLEEERLSIIERDNRLLLDKMSAIMRTKGRVDNKNTYEAKSLNREKREQEFLRVSRENQSILDRISKCEPQYQVEKWHDDWVKAEKYMDSIARYPRGWYLTRQQKHTAKEKGSSKQESEKDCSDKVEKAHGDSDDEIPYVEERKVKKGGKKGKEVVAAKKEGKTKTTNEKKIDNKADNRKQAGYKTGDEKDKTDGKAPSDDDTQKPNVQDDTVENEYLKEEHEEYTENDDNSDKESDSGDKDNKKKEAKADSESTDEE